MEKIISKSSLWLVGFQSLHVQFYLVLFLILRNFKNCLNIVDSEEKELDEIQPVPKVYTSKRIA